MVLFAAVPLSALITGGVLHALVPTVLITLGTWLRSRGRRGLGWSPRSCTRRCCIELETTPRARRLTNAYDEGEAREGASEPGG
jgi:hypothetical protein